MTGLSKKLLDQFVACVGADHVLTGSDDLSHYTNENRGIYHGKTPLVLKPGSTQEVAAIIKLAAETKTAIVPQGGHTGHVGGAVPDEKGNQIVVSMERMNRIRKVDIDGNAMMVEAGVILEAIQIEAEEHGKLFPLTLASQGSCQIGGNIATNAGGTGVIAYGNMRDQVLGLEVVLPSGKILDGLRSLHKDNTGYDLKNLFIGSEGTLGIITACVLKLRPKPRGKAVALAGLSSPEHALKLYALARERGEGMLTACELMPDLALQCTLRNIEGNRAPLEGNHAWYVLMEISSNRSEEDAQNSLENILQEGLQEKLVGDAAIAQTLEQQQALWRIRETVPLAQKQEGGSIKHDVAVPVHRVPEFLKRAGAIIKREMPDARIYSFGHLGDGNIHYNISQPIDGDKEVFLAHRQEINDLIHDLVIEMEGSVSAEHGIGRLKRDLLARTKSPVELQLMKQLKTTLDPNGIMNPGKVV